MTSTAPDSNAQVVNVDATLEAPQIARSSRFLPWLATLYLFIPNCLFIFGWTKWYWCLAFGILIPPLFFFLWKHMPAMSLPLPKGKKDWTKLSVAAVVLFLILRFSGIGNTSAITTDLETRNELFELLIERPWPVRYSEYGDFGMAYYIGFWIPAALFGKVFGVGAGYSFLLVWSLLGLLIVYLFLCSFLKRIVLLPLVLFVFFSGIDIVPTLLDLILGRTNGFVSGPMVPHIEWHSAGNSFSYNMPSHITSLYWIYNNSIPIWVVSFLLLNQKNNRLALFWLSACVLSSLLSALVLLVLTVFIAFMKRDSESIIPSSFVDKKTAKERFLQFFSFPNLVVGVFIALIAGAFLFSKADPNQITSNGVGLYISINSPIEVLLLAFYYFFEFGIYYVLCLKHHKTNPLLHILLLGFLLVPVFYVGKNQDLCMKGSVPLMLLLFLFVVDTLQKAQTAKQHVLLSCTSVFVSLGSVTAWIEIGRMVALSHQLYSKNNIVGLESLWAFSELAIVVVSILLLLILGRLFSRWRKIYSGCVTSRFTKIMASAVVISVSSFVLISFLASHFSNYSQWNQLWSISQIVSGPNFTCHTDLNYFYRFFAR